MASVHFWVFLNVHDLKQSSYNISGSFMPHLCPTTFYQICFYSQATKICCKHFAFCLLTRPSHTNRHLLMKSKHEVIWSVSLFLFQMIRKITKWFVSTQLFWSRSQQMNTESSDLCLIHSYRMHRHWAKCSEKANECHRQCVAIQFSSSRVMLKWRVTGTNLKGWKLSEQTKM